MYSNKDAKIQKQFDMEITHTINIRAVDSTTKCNAVVQI